MSEVKNMKIRIKDAEHSRKVQEHLFSLGYSWGFGVQKVQNTEEKVLTTYPETKTIYFLRYTSIEEHSNTEYLLEEEVTYSLKEVVPKVKEEEILEDRLKEQLNKAVQEALANAPVLAVFCTMY